MAPQLTYRKQAAKAVEGQRFDRTGQVLSVLNKHPQASQISEVTIASAQDNQAYRVAIDGVVAEYLSGTGATSKEIQEGMIAAIMRDPLIGGRVKAEEGSGDTKIVLSARHAGLGFDLEVGDGLTETEMQGAALADEVAFGRLVVLDEAPNPRGEINKYGKLATASSLQEQEVVISLTDVDEAQYTVSVSMEGKSYQGIATSAGSGEAVLAQALADSLSATLPAGKLTVEESDGDLLITSNTGGLGFEVSVGAGGGGGIVVDSDTGGPDTDIQKARLGVSLSTAVAGELATPKHPGDRSGAVKYQPNMAMNVIEDGRVWVRSEDSISGQDVYVRLSGDGELGGFRSSPAAGCVKLEGAKWFLTDGDKGVLDLHRR